MTVAPAITDRPGDVASAAAKPLQALYEVPTGAVQAVRGFGMPAELRARYDGDLIVPLRDDRPTVIANFVTTLDGVVALGTGDLSGGGLISGFYDQDRFVMALLRALADVVVVGAGTLRGSTKHQWIAEYVYPASARSFEAWREAMGLPTHPTTVIVTGSGDLPVAHAGLNDPHVPVVIATSDRGAERLRRAELGSWVQFEPISAGPTIPAERVVSLTRSIGARLVLSEGGPHLLADFVGAQLLDELFLTVAPQLVGRDDQRLGLLEGTALSPTTAAWQDLVSVRRSMDHLFLRYRARGVRLNTRES